MSAKARSSVDESSDTKAADQAAKNAKNKKAKKKDAKGPKMPTTPTAIELEIQARRDHLAATIDELSARLKPKEIVRRSAADVVGKARSLTHGPDGALRKERLAAVGGAAAVVAGVLVLLRRRRGK